LKWRRAASLLAAKAAAEAAAGVAGRLAAAEARVAQLEANQV
jgi:hypothetical protein